MNTLKNTIAVICLIFMSSAAYGQIKMPAASPTFELSGTIGLSKVKVVYSRPSAKGRQVFGDLVPYGEVWRTGANSSTKLSFDQTVILEGNSLEAGDYALYTIPGIDEWTIIISNNTELWGAQGYDEKDDILRFNVPAKSVSSHYESFTISFSDFTMNSAYLNMKWEKSKAKFKIEQDIDSQVMAQIKEQVIDAEPENAGVYYQAANYYFIADKDNKMALDFINKAIEGGQDRYWTYHLKAKIQARLGMKMEAETTAKKSIEKAREAGNMDYVRLNEKLIAELE